LFVLLQFRSISYLTINISYLQFFELIIQNVHIHQPLKYILLGFIFTIQIATSNGTKAEETDPNITKVPFSTNENNLTVWNGENYVPFFIKGINLGVSIPGTFPGQLAASKEQYSKWLSEIHDVGFNCIRVYTLHYPRFYEAVIEFNLANPASPVFIMHGIWLTEE